jgi:hypothetical protein
LNSSTYKEHTLLQKSTDKVIKVLYGTTTGKECGRGWVPQGMVYQD